MSLHAILGPMFASKTSTLLAYIRSYTILGYPMMVIKPDIDVRYTVNKISSHNQDTEECVCVPIDGLHTLRDKEEFVNAKVIFIEEAQFFSELYTFIQYCLDDCRKVIYITALNGDSKRQLFGEIYKLLPLCTKVEWLQALCIQCKNGTPGVYSKRIESQDANEQIVVGSTDRYEAVCLEHYLE